MYEKDDGIERLRRRFLNNMPTFLVGGNWNLQEKNRYRGIENCNENIWRWW